MRTFNKTFTIWLTSLLVLSLSAFSKSSSQLIPPQNSNSFSQTANNPQATPASELSVESAASEKKQKNNQPTKIPKPTGTPPVIPPPADPGASNAMIGLALISVIVILFGFWLNRQRVF